MRAVALVDGEHYPPVTLDAIERLQGRGYEFAAAVMLGGGEKLSDGLALGPLEVIHGATQREALERALDEHHPEVVVDLSDAPVVDTVRRFRLACVALARGIAYHGADFRLEPPRRPRITTHMTIAVIGTGKRTGKTAVAAAFARQASEAGLRTVIVAMGRGGPAQPVVTRGDLQRPTPEALLVLADIGEHAASDSYEDAVVAGVTTIGARRAGAGLAGTPFVDTVAEAVAVAEEEEPDLIVLEGSGTAIPPAAADATILVVGGATPAEDVSGGLGPMRLLISDLAVVTMAEEPVLAAGTLSALSSSVAEFAVSIPIVRTVFRPAPIESVDGAKIFVATTAPPEAGEAIRRHLEDVIGARVVGITHRLADRPGLSEDLRKAEGTYEVLVTELKAAAVDVATRTALAAGHRVVFADNIPIAVGGDIEAAFAEVLATATRRAEARA